MSQEDPPDSAQPDDSTLGSDSSAFSGGYQVERQVLDITEHSPLFIDNKRVYFEGFKALSDVDKARVLLGFLVENQNNPSIDNLENLNPTNLREKHQINRDNLQFKLKFWATAIIIGLIVIGTIITMGLFAYTSLDKGLLDENGTLTGIMSTLQEVLRIMFTDSSSSSNF